MELDQIMEKNIASPNPILHELMQILGFDPSTVASFDLSIRADDVVKITTTQDQEQYHFRPSQRTRGQRQADSRSRG
jgi:hypothetical protein